MIRWSHSQWFAACVSVVAWAGSATVAIKVSQGAYPVAWAWPGFVLSAVAAVGMSILVHETRHAQREDLSKIHRVS